MRGDVRDADPVRAVVAAPDVHIVFHFAAQTAVTTSLVAPREDLEVNVCGTHNVLEAVRSQRSSWRRRALLHLDEQGLRRAGPIAGRRGRQTRFRFATPRSKRTGSASRSRWISTRPTAARKARPTSTCTTTARIYGLRTVVFRMSCIYGPRQFGNEDQGWVAHFMRAVAEDRPLTIYGNGKQVRDLLFVDDLVRAFKLAALRIEQTAGHVYNIGGGPSNSISIWQRARPRLERLAGRRAARATWQLAPRRSADLRERHSQGAARFRLDAAGRHRRRPGAAVGVGAVLWRGQPQHQRTAAEARCASARGPRTHGVAQADPSLELADTSCSPPTSSVASGISA